MTTGLNSLRNLGISAHIDSGKTTLTERILFYTHRLHAMHEVKGKDGVGAKMDSMELERERGITIASAATHCTWRKHQINIIDTPGHVDFTIEVERALRVLDGAVLVLCAVAGVQSQSFTVDRQMRRYRVPRLAFINKCDRTGANPLAVRDQLREKLGHNAVLLQLPLGLAEEFHGVIDLVRMRTLTFTDPQGQQIVDGEIPAERRAEAEAARAELLDSVSMFSDELTEAMLDERVTEEILVQALRRATLALQVVPVLLGSAYKNKGVQPLLDAVIDYLPSPAEVVNEAVEVDGEAAYPLIADPARPLVALAFKLEDGRYGQLTYLRLYQGRLNRDDAVVNTRSRERTKVGRLVRMHADEMEEIAGAEAGDIVAVFGMEAHSGDTFTDGSLAVSMTSMFVPEPVISLAVKPVDHKSEANLYKALRRFSKEDPTFRVSADQHTGATIIHGMGELQLDVYLERMRREYQVGVTVSPPQVAYRETITAHVEYDYTHKKQTGGAGQYARVIGYLEPHPDEAFLFADEVRAGAVPRQFISAVEKGFRSLLGKGPLLGFPVVNVKVVLNDGNAHVVDSSDIAFQEAARGAWRASFARGRPRLLEPVMRIAVETPAEFAGNVLTTLVQRRGAIIGSQEDHGLSRIEAEAPLAEMFGYATVLRSATQGKAEFTMEFARYTLVPAAIEEKLIAAAKQKAANG